MMGALEPSAAETAYVRKSHLDEAIEDVTIEDVNCVEIFPRVHRAGPLLHRRKVDCIRSFHPALHTGLRWEESVRDVDANLRGWVVRCLKRAVREGKREHCAPNCGTRTSPLDSSPTKEMTSLSLAVIVLGQAGREVELETHESKYVPA